MVALLFSHSILFKDGAICQQSVNDRAKLDF
jgi:hypothetical protein